MKRRLSSITHMLVMAVAAATLLSGTWAFAQTKATVYVPFAFTANHQTMAAGHYKLELLSNRFLVFSDKGTGEHRAAILVNPDSAPYIETRGRLKFIVDGSRYYLVDVQFAGSSLHSTTVIQPSLARELKAQNTAASTVEIAMK
ncbi:hypothetical protein [Occallatibacter riparius]|uniref:DUF2846 domain-containing protein n=1 Tax=Occallatibacter riparius TaxID=1002689 RepID=A0A9J7BQA8_9BACT|nr:hypothetical protein [Occallatibacter riparius]UWZ84775.1 hypothetical protein MOP44_02295 [Occallatibacter riparius]